MPSLGQQFFELSMRSEWVTDGYCPATDFYLAPFLQVALVSGLGHVSRYFIESCHVEVSACPADVQQGMPAEVDAIAGYDDNTGVIEV